MPGTLVQPGRYPAPGSVCGTTGRAPKTTCQRVTLLSRVYVFFTVPETKNLTLTQIEQQLSGTDHRH